MNITLQDQLAEARAELAIRQRAYQKWVQEGRMTQEKADIKIATMEAICTTLDRMVGLEAVSKEILGE